MLHAAVLAAALSAAPDATAPQALTTIQKCFATMDGAVYHGDPSDRHLMQANVATCAQSLAQMNALRPKTPAQGPAKLFLTGRILDRAATLHYMGLGDRSTAQREVTTANLYFRVASGLTNVSESYHEAALANVRLTGIQLRTLHADEIASAARNSVARKLTAYHKL